MTILIELLRGLAPFPESLANVAANRIEELEAKLAAMPDHDDLESELVQMGHRLAACEKERDASVANERHTRGVLRSCETDLRGRLAASQAYAERLLEALLPFITAGSTAALDAVKKAEWMQVRQYLYDQGLLEGVESIRARAEELYPTKESNHD